MAPPRTRFGKRRYQWAIDFETRWGEAKFRAGVFKAYTDREAMRKVQRRVARLRTERCVVSSAELKRAVPFRQSWWTAEFFPDRAGLNRWVIEEILPGYRFVEGLPQRERRRDDPEPPKPAPEKPKRVALKDMEWGLIQRGDDDERE